MSVIVEDFEVEGVYIESVELEVEVRIQVSKHKEEFWGAITTVCEVEYSIESIEVTHIRAEGIVDKDALVEYLLNNFYEYIIEEAN